MCQFVHKSWAIYSVESGNPENSIGVFLLLNVWYCLVTSKICRLFDAKLQLLATDAYAFF
jgi:hypothetical protein